MTNAATLLFFVHLVPGLQRYIPNRGGARRRRDKLRPGLVLPAADENRQRPRVAKTTPIQTGEAATAVVLFAALRMVWSSP